MHRYPFPGALPRARSNAAIEAQLRLAIGDAAYDAMPDAPARHNPHEPRPLGGAAGTIIAEAAEACRKAAQELKARTRPKPRQAAAGASRGSARRLSTRPPREKCFGAGRPLPLDRNGKLRILVRAKVLMRKTEPGKHYGEITPKALGVLLALIFGFHNTKSGLCFPSYKAIAAKARCTVDTVGRAIKMLEAAGLMTWCNRLARVVIDGVKKVIRTSNSYRFIDLGSKSDLRSGTDIHPYQEHSSLVVTAEIQPQEPAEKDDRTRLVGATLSQAIGKGA